MQIDPNKHDSEKIMFDAIRLGVIPDFRSASAASEDQIDANLEAWLRLRLKALFECEEVASSNFADIFASPRGTTTGKRGVLAFLLLRSFARWRRRFANFQGPPDPKTWWLMCKIENADAPTHSYLRGYLDGLQDARDRAHAEAAKSRRKIGASKRERVRQLAEPHRGLMSKEKAAFDIAESIGASPGSIKKMLTELFPGSDWTEKRERSAD